MLRTMHRLRRREDGGAAVEFAVLMFILCPLWFFTMFSSDAMFHMLDVQETVLSATWDLSQQQFGTQRQGLVDTVGRYNRLQFADHDSSFTNESELSGGFSAEDHHTNPFGHTCFCQSHGDCRKELTPYTNTDAAHQVACERKTELDVGFKTPSTKDLASAVGGEGGVWECGAKGWLFNYLIPEHFIPDFKAAERVPLFTRKKRTDGQHQNTGALSADILLREHAAIVLDPWAVTEKSNGGVTQGFDREQTGSVFYTRTKSLFNYKVWYGLPAAQAMGFMGKAASKKLGVAPAVMDGAPTIASLDNILGLWMNVQYPSGKTGGSVGNYTDNDGFFTTPLLPNSKERQVFNDSNRGYHYMGRKR